MSRGLCWILRGEHRNLPKQSSTLELERRLNRSGTLPPFFSGKSKDRKNTEQHHCARWDFPGLTTLPTHSSSVSSASVCSIMVCIKYVRIFLIDSGRWSGFTFTVPCRFFFPLIFFISAFLLKLFSFRVKFEAIEQVYMFSLLEFCVHQPERHEVLFLTQLVSRYYRY